MRKINNKNRIFQLIEEFEKDMAKPSYIINTYFKMKSSNSVKKLEQESNHNFIIKCIAEYLNKKYANIKIDGKMKEDYEILFNWIVSPKKIKNSPCPSSQLDVWRNWANNYL